MADESEEHLQYLQRHGILTSDGPTLKTSYIHTDEETAKDERVRAIIERYEQQVRDLQKGWGSHIHSFQYCLNANHTAIRGCATCGYTCGTLVQGNDPRQLEWHPIREPEEQEEEDGDE